MDSPVRALTLRQTRKDIQKANGENVDPPLGPDQMQLYSYFRPSLVAGTYFVEAVQNIRATVHDQDLGTTKQQTLQVSNVRQNAAQTLDPQEFEVMVPRFTIDPALINSFYPPEGHEDEGRVLPHIVFNDPHYPWEIDAGITQNMHGQIDNDRNIVPWVALLVFDPEDLRLASIGDINALNVPGITSADAQNAKGTFSMQVSQYFSIPQGSRINFEKGFESEPDLLGEIKGTTDLTQVIFPTKQQFVDLFSEPEGHKYLAHVRNINTVGFPDAGVEEVGYFSIVISSRCGNFDITKPKTQICHLVSMEHVDSTLEGVKQWLDQPEPTTSDRIGLFSLYSWIYTALPPNPVNFIDTVENLVQYQQMLRTDDQVIKGFSNAAEKADPNSPKANASNLFLDRLLKGYTLTRWRTETGEETAAFTRGPLVPLPVTWPPTADLPDCSNTSKEFQILDKSTGLMDLSYSSAWQLGKTLAISDTVFSAALMRFRSTLYNLTASETRMKLNAVLDVIGLLDRLEESTAGGSRLSNGQTGNPQRTPVANSTAAKVDVKSPGAKAIFKKVLESKIEQRTNAGKETFTGFNKDPPNDSDWALILNWIADKLSLADIPPHVLIPEPSFVPPEALRFFYIDDWWLDCMIDGALSVANHLDREDDLVRIQMKQRFNTYLSTPVPAGGNKPQIPRYGFILRSQIVKAMPDLRITVNWKDPDTRAPVCRYTKYDETTILCLLDRWPEDLQSIVLGQAAHQQRFSLGASLDKDRLQFIVRHLYTSITDTTPVIWPVDTNQPFEIVDKSGHVENQTSNWFNWKTRSLQLNVMAKELNALLQHPEDQSYVDNVPNSCEFGLELNDPCYFFEIAPPKDSDPTLKLKDRQLYVNTADDLDLVPETPLTDASKPSTTTPAQNSKKPPPVIPKPPNIQTRLQPIPTSIQASTISKAGPLEIQSQFTLAVYPDYKTYPIARTREGYHKDAYVPTQNLYYFDLIFSVRKKDMDAQSPFPLLEIQIVVPTSGLDPGGHDPKREPLLLQNYDGPGVRMVANQRFIPFHYTDPDNHTIRLMPRTAADNYQMPMNDGRTTDVTFRLAEANIAPLRAGQFLPIAGLTGPDKGRSQWRGLVDVTMVEVYATTMGSHPVTTIVEVVKNPTRDPEDVALDALA